MITLQLTCIGACKRCQAKRKYFHPSLRQLECKGSEIYENIEQQDCGAYLQRYDLNLSQDIRPHTLARFLHHCIDLACATTSYRLAIYFDARPGVLAPYIDYTTSCGEVTESKSQEYHYVRAASVYMARILAQTKSRDRLQQSSDIDRIFRSNIASYDKILQRQHLQFILFVFL